MSRQVRNKLTDPSQVPTNMSEEERVKFWQTHRLSRDFFAKLRPTPEDERPSRTKPISIRIEEDVLEELKTLARQMRVAYQTLLKEFVVAGLGREEASKAGAVDAQSLAVLPQILEQLEGHGSTLAEILSRLEGYEEKLVAVQTSYGTPTQESLTPIQHEELIKRLMLEINSLEEEVRRLEADKASLREEKHMKYREQEFKKEPAKHKEMTHAKDVSSAPTTK